MADTYKAGVELTLNDGAFARSAGNVQNRLSQLAGASANLQNKILGAARNLLTMGTGALGVSVGIGALARQVYVANTELDKTKKQMAGALFAFTRWKDGVSSVDAVTASLNTAQGAVEKLEEAEYKLAVPVEELGQTYRMLAGSVIGRLGQSQEKLLGLTEGVAAASKIFNRDAGSMAMSIARIIEMRSIRGIDPFSVFLRQAIGNTKELKKMAPDKLLDLINSKLNTLGPGAQKMAEGFGGTMFRLRDFLSDTIRDIGRPAFEYIGKKMDEWRGKLHSITDGGKTLASVYGDRVLKVIKSIVSAVETLAEHWKTIAVLVGGMKLAGVAGGVAAGISGMAGAIGSVTSGMTNLANVGISPLLTATTLLATAITALFTWLESRLDQQKKMANEGANIWQGFRDLTRAQATGDSERARRALGYFRAQGIISGAGGQVSTAALSKYVGAMDQGDRANLAAALNVKLPSALQETFLAETFRTRLEKLSRQFPEFDKVTQPETKKSLENLAKSGPPKITNNFTGPININQKFEEADPDDVYIRFRDDIESEAIKRTMSPLAEWGGA